MRFLSLLFILAASCLPSCHGLAATMPPLTKTAQHLPLARKAMEYFDSSSDPFHAVQTSIEMLTKAGFKELNDVEPYTGKIQPGGKYYFTRNRSTLVAFSVGSQYIPGQGGFKVIGGHTDSPNLKVKPRSKRSAKTAQSIQVGVECYGGGLWHTWFDRDLGVSGRVLVNVNSGADGGANKIQQKLIKIDRAIMRIPNLAIHLLTADERKAFKVNNEDHLSPILAMAAQTALGGVEEDSSDDKKKKEKEEKNGWKEFQEPVLLQLIASELGIQVDEIVDFELNLFDVQKAALGGVHSEFVHSSRLDNLASCFLAVQALVEFVEEDKVADDKDISMVVLYDHEEVGSNSAVGAASPILGESVKRISSALTDSATASASAVDMYEATIRRSFVLSSDQAHALHPNYASKHEKNHQPQMNAGMVIKRNSNQRYATNGITGVLMREVARRAGLPPVQEFMVRQDCGCGSTIGPLISATTGIRAIDMGCPQLSMHSIRETMGVCDLTNGLDLFKAFFTHFREVDDSVEQ